MRLLFSIVVLLLTAAFATGEELTDARKAELSYLVLQDCGSCHGMTMKGGLGSALTPESLDGADVEALASIILDGIPGQPMPPWRGLVTPDEALWIAGALKEGTIK